MATIKVTPRSLTDAYKVRQGDASPNLVGLQFTNGSSIFTFGNFEITSNFQPKLAKDFMLGGEWSDYYSLNNLNLTQETSTALLSNDLNVRLNFNPLNIDRYVYFGSFYELTKVTVETIIQKWKGSVYVNPQNNTNAILNTILSFKYDSGDDSTTFLIPKDTISNKFELLLDSDMLSTGTSPGEIYDVNNNYNKYVIWDITSNTKKPVIGFTGYTDSYPYLTVKTSGNPFPTLTGSTFGQLSYHMMPISDEINTFFLQLTDFEKVLLNNLTSPVYTSKFSAPLYVEGTIVFTEKSFTWPTTDGYNIDIDTYDYRTYIETLLTMTSEFDSYKTDLVSRRFVSESIQEYDTVGDGTDIYGKKIKKLLRIYGREFDEVKKYIDGISFANVVTYDKLDNTSDELIKVIAKNLGFDFFLTTTNGSFNLLEQLETGGEPVFSGYSRNLSAKELDIELWRRLVINAWWLYKSKGTRKVIEFFFKLFKIPECMVSLNEYVYLAKERLNPSEVFNELVKIYDVPSNMITLSSYPMDEVGFPKMLPENNDNFFQKNGFWYNGGSESTLGNNPHVGPYDFGKNYFNQFECFVNDVNSYITGSTLVTVRENSFNNYNNGTFIFDQNGLPVQYYGTAYADSLNNNDLVQNVVVNSAGLTYVGGNNSPIYGRPSGDTYSMKINFTAGSGKKCDIDCDYNLKYGDDGVIYIVGTPNKPLTDRNCCENYWLPSSKEILLTGKTVTASATPYQMELGGPRTMVTEQAIQYQYFCYWCPPDDNIKTICSSTDYVNTLSSQNITNLATSLGWTSTQNVTAKIYLETTLSGYFSTNCLILDYDNKAITNKPCCELKGGTWSFNSQINSYQCTLNKPNTCSDISVNNYHILVDSKGDNATTECCTNLGKQYTSGTILVYENNSYYNTIQDTVGIYGFSLNNTTLNKVYYCTDCPKTINVVGGYVYNYQSNLDLTSKCCTDYGFSYSTSSGKCSKCPITTINQLQSDGSTVMLSDTNTNLSQVCCDNVNGWYGVSSMSPTVSKCYLCAPSTNTGYNFSVNSTYTELQFNGESLTQSCCLYYQTSVGGGIQWDPNLNKCLANSGNGTGTGTGTGTASGTGSGTASGTNYQSELFNLKLGNSWCGLVGTGTINVNEALINVSYPLPNVYDAPTHISGVVNMLYTPLGLTPLTGPIYINSGLTALLTPKSVLISTSNVAFYNVINYTGPANLTGLFDKHFIVFEYPLTNSIYLLDFTNNAVYNNNVLTSYVFDIVNPYPVPVLLSPTIGGTC